jgi:N6-L-threonylcarbamoyladenine synthase
LTRNALILGIESSCDETAAAVVRDGRDVLANVVASQHEFHAKFGGVVPEIASRAHIERIVPVLQQALEEAGVTTAELDAVAVGHRPGLIGSLLVGLSAAKSLAWSLDRPLLGVDHVEAHLYAAALNAEPIEYPALGLVVSGGHTTLYEMDGPLQMRPLGRTIDDAVGEAYDKVASVLELGFPGGPVIDRMAAEGDAEAVRFPRTLLEADSLDFSFSGLKTAVLYRVRGKPSGRGAEATLPHSAAELDHQQKADIAASFQAAAMEVLMEKLNRAARRLESEGRAPRSLVIGGGVSANRELRRRAEAFGEQRGLPVRLPAMAHCIDNAAMLAGLGYHRLAAGEADALDLEAAATTQL